MKRTHSSLQMTPSYSGNMTKPTVSHSKMKPPLSQNKSQLPFAHKRFFLDLTGCPFEVSLTKDLKMLGGKVDPVFSKEVSCVISNRISPKTKDVVKDGKNSIRFPYGRPLTPNSTTMCSSPQFFNECSLDYPDSPSNTSSPAAEHALPPMSRGMALLHKAVHKKQGTTDVLESCKKYNIKVYPVDKVLSTVKEFKRKYSLPRPSQTKKDDRKAKGGKDVKKLSPPFIKIEDIHQKFKPKYIEISSWTSVIDPGLSHHVNELHKQFKKSGFVDKVPRNTLGDINSSPSLLRGANAKLPLTATASITKSYTENVSIACQSVSQQVLPSRKRPAKENVEKPKKQKTTHAKKKMSYCEICRVDYSNLEKHLSTEKHMNFLSDPLNFLDVQNIIMSLPKKEDFLLSYFHETCEEDLSCNYVEDGEPFDNFQSGSLLVNEQDYYCQMDCTVGNASVSMYNDIDTEPYYYVEPSCSSPDSVPLPFLEDSADSNLTLQRRYTEGTVVERTTFTNCLAPDSSRIPDMLPTDPNYEPVNLQSTGYFSLSPEMDSSQVVADSNCRINEVCFSPVDCFPFGESAAAFYANLSKDTSLSTLCHSGKLVKDVISGVVVPMDENMCEMATENARLSLSPIPTLEPITFSNDTNVQIDEGSYSPVDCFSFDQNAAAFCAALSNSTSLSTLQLSEQPVTKVISGEAVPMDENMCEMVNKSARLSLSPIPTLEPITFSNDNTDNQFSNMPVLVPYDPCLFSQNFMEIDPKHNCEISLDVQGEKQSVEIFGNCSIEVSTSNLEQTSALCEVEDHDENKWFDPFQSNFSETSEVVKSIHVIIESNYLKQKILGSHFQILHISRINHQYGLSLCNIMHNYNSGMIGSDLVLTAPKFEECVIYVDSGITIDRDDPPSHSAKSRLDSYAREWDCIVFVMESLNIRSKFLDSLLENNGGKAMVGISRVSHKKPSNETNTPPRSGSPLWVNLLIPSKPKRDFPEDKYALLRCDLFSENTQEPLDLSANTSVRSISHEPCTSGENQISSVLPATCEQSMDWCVDNGLVNNVCPASNVLSTKLNDTHVPFSIENSENVTGETPMSQDDQYSSPSSPYYILVEEADFSDSEPEFESLQNEVSSLCDSLC